MTVFTSVRFFPTDLSSCAVWLDARDAQTLTFSGSAITAWRNKGAAGNATATAGNEPIYTTVSGRPVVRLADNTDFMTIADSAALDYSQFALYAVLTRNLDTGASQQAIRKGITTTSNLEFALNVSSTDRLNINASTNGTSATTTFNLNAPAPAVNVGTLYLVHMAYDGTNVIGQIGTSTSTSASGALFADTGTFNLGGTGSGRMDYCEVLFYTRYPSADERASIVAHLKRKWEV